MLKNSNVVDWGLCISNVWSIIQLCCRNHQVHSAQESSYLTKIRKLSCEVKKTLSIHQRKTKDPYHNYSQLSTLIRNHVVENNGLKVAEKDWRLTTSTWNGWKNIFGLETRRSSFGNANWSSNFTRVIGCTWQFWLRVCCESHWPPLDIKHSEQSSWNTDALLCRDYSILEPLSSNDQNVNWSKMWNQNVTVAFSWHLSL